MTFSFRSGRSPNATYSHGSASRRSPRRSARLKLGPETLESRTLLSTVSWVGGSGDWSVGANWSNGTGPGAGDDAVIDVPNISVTHASGADKVRSLTFNDAFSLSGGVLTVTGNVQKQDGISFTSSLTLAGGTLASATVAAGTTITVLSGTLDGVTANGDIDLTEQPNSSLNILDGLVLDGTMSVGKADGTTWGIVTFGNGATADQSISGSGTVVFGARGNNALINNDGSGGVLTIGSTIFVHGYSGSIANSSAAGAIVNRGAISAEVSYGAITFGSNQNDASSLGTLINRGTLEATGGGSLRLDGGWSNAGKIRSAADSKAYLNGTFSTAALGTITADGGKVVLDGTLINTGSSLALGFATGSWDVAQGTIKGGTVRVSDARG